MIIKGLTKKIAYYVLIGDLLFNMSCSKPTSPPIKKFEVYKPSTLNQNKYMIEFTNKNFQKEVIESKIPVMVDFWAPWCGTCRIAEPTIEKLAKKYYGKIKIGQLNIDEADSIAINQKIGYVPTIKIYKNSREIESIVGVQDDYKSRLETIINSVMTKND